MADTNIGCCSSRMQNLSPTIGTTYNFGSTYRHKVGIKAIFDTGSIPVFDNLPATVYLPETYTVTGAVYTVRASDVNRRPTSGTPVFGNDGDTLYIGLDNGMSTFSSAAYDGNLITTAALDYETTNSYELVFKVWDGGTNISPDGLTGTGTLTVVVQDVNEAHSGLNIPASITLDARVNPVGSVIYDVDISDPDFTGTYTYIINSAVPNDGQWTIDIDGQVTCALDLALTMYSSYVLSISVFDGTYMFGPSDLTITVEDIRTSPVIHNLPITVTVPEDMTVGTGIFQIYATDADNDMLTYSISAFTPQSGDTKFYINSTTGLVQVYNNPGFDVAIFASYALTIDVADSMYSTSNTLTINVNDINDPPYFNVKTYTATVSENLVNTDLIGITLDATDPEGDALTYSLRPSEFGSSLFSVTGGVVRAAANLKLNAALTTAVGSYNYLLTVIVSDAEYSDLGLLNITVQNMNDQHAVTNMAPSGTTVSVDSQTTVAGQNLFQVAVSPKEPFDSFTYTMTTPNPNHGLFYMNPVSGILSATKPLSSWIKASSYNMQITVLDTQGLSDGPYTLTVQLTNQKQPPVITNLPFTVTIAEDLEEETDIYQITATDADSDAILSYNLASSTGTWVDSNFQWNSQTGLLRTSKNCKFDAETETTYTFSFTVTDYLFTSTTVVLTVSVSNINEAPEYTTHSYTVVIEEEMAVGTLLSLTPNSFDATDPDLTTPTYSMLPSPYNQYFTLSGSTLRINQRMDFDSGITANMELHIQATDGSLTDLATVIVNVTDINDNSPVFTSSYYTGSVAENAYGGFSILQITANDLDSPAQTSIRYNMTQNYVDDGSLGDYFFEVDPTTGVIYVKSQMDYETYSWISFDVLVTDQGTNPGPLTDLTTVNITITDANDFRPEIKQKFINMEAPSFVELGYNITTFEATDDDQSVEFADLQFFLLMDDNLEYFSIGQRDGRLVTSAYLENDITYQVYCFVRDHSWNPKISTAAVVRFDSFSGWKFLVDVSISMSLGEFEPREADFTTALGNALDSWTVKVWKARDAGDSGGGGARRRLLQSPAEVIVTMYAMYDNRSDLIENIDLPKNFVYRDQLLAKMRTSIYGTPTPLMTTGDLSEFGIVKVEPTQPIWIIDTVPGIVTISASSFLLVGLVILSLVLCCWALGFGCFKKRKNSVKEMASMGNSRTQLTDLDRPDTQGSDDIDEQFDLSYKTPSTQTPIVVAPQDDMGNLRWRKENQRRPVSVDTIHSTLAQKNNIKFQTAPPLDGDGFDLSYNNLTSYA